MLIKTNSETYLIHSEKMRAQDASVYPREVVERNSLPEIRKLEGHHEHFYIHRLTLQAQVYNEYPY